MEKTLVVTRRHDPTADYVIERMVRRKIGHVRLNSDEFGSEYPFLIHFPDSQSYLAIDGKPLSFCDIKSIWLRRLSETVMDSMPSGDARQFAEQENSFSLRWLLGLMENRTIDPEIRLRTARNKFDQLSIASKIGFTTPKTLITNEPTKAKDFCEAQACIVKSIAGFGMRKEGGFEAVYTNKVTPEILRHIERVRLAPVCFQENVAKAFELRVTAVGSQLFSCKIDSQETERTKTDWRRYDSRTPHSIYQTDGTTESRILRLMKHYNIKFASFDFIVTPEDNLVFLEMNPGSQFIWIEELTGLKITDALIDELQKM